MNVQIIAFANYFASYTCTTRDLTSLDATENIASSEMQALKDLYAYTQGEIWLWDFSDPNAIPDRGG